MSFFGIFLRRVDCGLGFFARHLVSRNFAEDCTTVSRPEGLPMPIPYVEALRSSSLSPADPADWALKRGVNAVILALNYLHLGRPRRAPVSIRLGARLTRGQWECVHHISAPVEAWVAAAVIGPEEMGRGAGKIERRHGS